MVERYWRIMLLLVCLFLLSSRAMGSPQEDKIVEEMLKITNILHQNKCFEREIAMYKRILEKYPQTTWLVVVRFNLAECYRVTGQFEEAKKLYKEIRTDYPQSKEASLSVLKEAEILSKEGKHKESASLLNSFIESHPQDSLVPDALLMLGEEQYKMCKTSDAVNTYKLLLRTYPSHPIWERAFENLKSIWSEQAVLKYISEEYRKEKVFYDFLNLWDLFVPLIKK